MPKLIEADIVNSWIVPWDKFKIKDHYDQIVIFWDDLRTLESDGALSKTMHRCPE